MRIVKVKEETVSIASQIKNAYIDFSKMTVSALALVTDVVRDGKPVVGYGFNSNGRYAQGALLRERFIPRLMAADPATLLDETEENLDPFKIWQILMKNEKPGGHQFALHIAAGLGLGGNESYPGIFAPFGGFADTTPVENGTIGLTQAPGIGFEEKSELISLFRRLFA